jgi:hypothetical protein
MSSEGGFTASGGAAVSCDAAIVRQALRLELETRGCRVASDTVGHRGELYIWGAGDRAAAMFEFKSNAEEAMRTMYQGSWPPTLPPRFAVLPASEKDAPALDMLTQAGLSILLYQATGGGVVFVELESALAKMAEPLPM